MRAARSGVVPAVEQPLEDGGREAAEPVLVIQRDDDVAVDLFDLEGPSSKEAFDEQGTVELAIGVDIEQDFGPAEPAPFDRNVR